MSATYEFDWRKTLTEFIDDMSKFGISEIERVEPEQNEIQVDW